MPTECIVLRTHRKKWALTQRELADLIGIASQQHVSHVERSMIVPGIKVVLALEIVFGVCAKQLFPKLFDEIEDEVVRNLYQFGERLKSNVSKAAARKRQLVAEALSRATLSAE